MDQTMATGGGGLQDEFDNLASVLAGGPYRRCDAQ
jgi:hypothetical protein